MQYELSDQLLLISRLIEGKITQYEHFTLGVTKNNVIFCKNVSVVCNSPEPYKIIDACKIQTSNHTVIAVVILMTSEYTKADR